MIELLVKRAAKYYLAASKLEFASDEEWALRQKGDELYDMIERVREANGECAGIRSIHKTENIISRECELLERLERSA